MGKNDDDSDAGSIDFDNLATRNSSGGSSSGSSSSSSTRSDGDRGMVIIDGQYGDIVLSPDTKCSRCGRLAEGVFPDRSGGDGDGVQLVDDIPLCESHREEFAEENSDEWDEYAYKKF